MRFCLLILSYFISSNVIAQPDEIYRLTFSDKSNFELTTLLDHKMPEKFLILDTTQTWNSNRFWLKDLDKKNKETFLREIQNDEHHPYFNIYLFRDTSLNKLFSDQAKRELSISSEKIGSRHIQLANKNYRTISSSKNIKGFYFVTSEPLFSADQRFAFIDLTVYYKDNYTQEEDDSYFGTICIVFQKQGKTWKKIGGRERLIL